MKRGWIQFRTLMSWGNRMATAESSGLHPTGIIYDKHVDLWMDSKEMKRILNDSPDGMRLYLEGWGQTLGEAVFDNKTNQTITAFKRGFALHQSIPRL